MAHYSTLWEEEQTKIQNVFNKIKIKETEEIGLQDFWIFTREIFDIHDLLIYEDKIDDKDIFNKPDTYKTMISTIQNYFKDRN